mgnify:CR=1 FL=1
MLNEKENTVPSVPGEEELRHEIQNESIAEADEVKHHDSEDRNENTASEDLLSKIGLNKKDKLKKENKELKDKVEELNDKYLRLMAEMDNMRKRNVKERMEWITTAGQEILNSMLPVLDDFNRAAKTFETASDITAVKEGVQLIHQKLQNTLSAKGLKPMKSIGELFNPEMHEAITEIPVADENMKGRVVDEVECGYYLNEKIIRYAKVVVGK